MNEFIKRVFNCFNFLKNCIYYKKKKFFKNVFIMLFFFKSINKRLWIVYKFSFVKYDKKVFIVVVYFLSIMIK